jgi:hypothetical protein
MSLPRWADDVISTPVFKDSYALLLRLNPFFQVGDFDRDGSLDVAVCVLERTTGKEGVALIRHERRGVTVIGAGQSFGNGGDDFQWMGIWRVEPAQHGDVLYVEKPESAGGTISWNGSGFDWTQAGD